ncbi:putative glucosamine-6-phosphate deaminase-like protein BT_0258 [uncultured Paludibacter sp.]|nr:putative glucosamine-6-phosphate deaminase-like protein BT_0258 [uncultured Paludibacter sp.]
MIFDLSSKITLERIPTRYFRPSDALEATRQTRYEKLRTDIYETEKKGALAAANEVAALIREKQKKNQSCVLGLPGGSSPLNLYAELVRLHTKEGLSFKNVYVFNVSEFYPVEKNRHSNAKIIREYLISKVDLPENHFFTPDENIKRNEVLEFCQNYEQKIEELGGLDLVIGTIGQVGNLAYNEQGSQTSSTTRLMLLDAQSRSDLSQFYIRAAEVPVSAITMGLATILSAKKVILIAWGENKAKILKEIIEGQANDSVPASFLQLHKNAHAILDLSSSQFLTRISHPWLVGSCEWTDKLIRRAIVWLCNQTKKPILKLTNKDYNKYGLDELLALYGSAYNVNIKIFNDLQRTITGWPGGKPNADDSNRPERALPYPKRVIIFSPHPDDDVISMGGTFQRLVDQGHIVHVAYETSGNIAVGDDEAIRYLGLMKNVLERFDPADNVLKQKYETMLRFLKEEKKTGDSDTPDVLYLKGWIRREEARAACRYNGVPIERVHHLDLPFYETGKIKKGDISEKDVRIIMNLLQEVEPHQIFVAGDLADPHGTHKICLDAVLGAIHELINEEWMKDCRVWMYRGAWAEWEIDHIEMAVPISPEELRKKRNSILKHQSQMESAPFMGNDERLFWQRAEERNQATAKMYNELGLAAYEAIEAFVEYKKM